MAKEKKAATLSNMSQAGLIWFRYKKNKLAVIGLIVIIIEFIICMSAKFWIPYEDVYTQNLTQRFVEPCAAHPFGTDQFGRDLFARVLYGGQISLTAGFMVVGISLAIGVTIGGFAGYFGGRIDMILMRICDIFMAIPRLLLAMAIVSALGQGTEKLLVALSLSSFTGFARTTRASILNLRGREFIEAAKVSGASDARILYTHIVPNGIGPVVISATMSLGGTILAIASLGFLGIGIAPPTPEWGTILSENKSNLRYYPYLGFIPGICIGITVMCLNFCGDGLRDALDPRTKN